MTRLYTPIEGVQPEAAKFGLLNSKTLAGIGSTSARWETGFAVDSLACNSAVRIVGICASSDTVSATEATGEPWSVAPFAVQAEYKCSTFGFGANDYFEKAKQALELCQSKAIERELWTGELAQLDAEIDSEGNGNPNRYLASPDAVDVTPTPGTPIKPAFGLALLEKALADCGCGAQGVIHAPRGVASSLGEHNVEIVGDHLETQLGTVLIAGTGYPGTGPDGTDPGGTEAWMYATGTVSVLLGESDVITNSLSEATNTSINEVSATAERLAAVGWDGCCHFGVLVDLSLDYS